MEQIDELLEEYPDYFNSKTPDFITKEDVDYEEKKALNNTEQNQKEKLIISIVVNQMITLNYDSSSLGYKQLTTTNEPLYHQCDEIKETCPCQKPPYERIKLWVTQFVENICKNQEDIVSTAIFGGKYGYIVVKYEGQIYFGKYIIESPEGEKDFIETEIRDFQENNSMVFIKKFENSEQLYQHLVKKNIIRYFAEVIKENLDIRYSIMSMGNTNGLVESIKNYYSKFKNDLFSWFNAPW